MGRPTGNLGGIAVVEEVTWGTTPGTPTWIWQHPMPSPFIFNREQVEPNLLSYAGHSARGYSGGYAGGDLVMGLDLRDAVMGPVLGLAGTLSGGDYRMGGGDAPDVNSISALLSYGGGGATPANNHEWIHTGVKPNAVVFEIVPDSNSFVTLTGTGKGTTKTAIGSAQTPSPPAETSVVMPSDIGTITVDGDTVCFYNGTISVLVPKTGFEKKCLGGTMREQATNGRPDVTFSLNCSLDDATGSDTIAILADFVAGVAIGDIVIGNHFVLTNCLLSGDFPPLADGDIDFVLNGSANYLDVTVT